MGFLSKLFKKAKPFLPIALSMFGPPGLNALAGSTWGTKLGLGSLFSGMNPMARNMLMQSAMGYGTAALSGSKRPGKAAMYAGLASLPFSYMSAASTANRFNDPRNRYGATARRGRLVPGTDEYKVFGNRKIPSYPTKSIYTASAEGPFAAGKTYKMPKKWKIELGPNKGDKVKLLTGGRSYPTADSFIDVGGKGGRGNILYDMTTKYKKPVYETFGDPLGEVSAWDILSGKTKGMKIPQMIDPNYTYSPGDPKDAGLLDKWTQPMDANIFTKTTPVTDVAGNILDYETKANWLPTAASQAAGLYGGRMTPEEEWEAAQKKRKKELAWMYGVPEDMIEGEMTNPWSSGSFWNRGGIASLENGGDVSGPGTGTSDSINANLSDGEFVMTAKAVENLGGGDRYTGARKMYDLMNVLDPESETMTEAV